MEIFKVQDLTYCYPKSEKPALKNINISINEGEFILLIGKSGSGKSTFGRLFNSIVPQFYGGTIKGHVEGTEEVGMVFQDPEKQLVMDKVEREIAFGLENMGMDNKLMKKRVAEVLSFLNMWEMKDKKTYELSGGQKQKTAIASVIAVGNRFLVLDEPTSQLDPVSGDEILHILKRLNEELGYTILLIEQRIDRCFHLADRILLMENRQLIFDGSAENFEIWNKDKEISLLPSVPQLFLELNSSPYIPLTVKEGRRELRRIIGKKSKRTWKPEKIDVNDKSEVINIKKMNYIYENGTHAIKDLSLSIFKGEILGIAGENGGGKSTLLKNISGILKPTSGKIFVEGEIGFLSQDPNDYLFNDTVYEELKYTLDNKNIKDCSRIEKTLEELELYEYRDKNPRDLSSGERQRVALASILVMEPEILLLDEPTRGLDIYLKRSLGEILINLKKKGKTIILVTHDIEFLSKISDRICLIFDGTGVQIGTKYEILTSGIHYSTQINKLFTGYVDNILTVEDGINAMNLFKEEGAV
ncbi:ABC transporter ATP-binding protein [Maledivibacter halophilus]|uniref:Energy-coupling factor transport system ATP-binding protein n=1 Tax=Maledivibacter halophilus TaxID=36842 RepID=A0A1T5J2J4_9FIRM|nr:ATP-binding cassette domain-containing protein [Maledivibacter halophilus]SKC45727.1 energy-coupling factor transport system ATP-binding protein [Maledivibacter halophilus]